MPDTSDGYIHVDYQGVVHAAEELARETSAIRTTLKDLETELHPLVSSWEGADSAEYTTKQHEWDMAAARMGEILRSHGNLLGDIHDGYRSNEKRLAQTWADVPIGR
ncbi:WXG100 family type VII secretion target [Streptomyces sp. NPDC020681]|uniref:WXG100 family type VII secretion target n=1 Tax=Streptomyces sp. NPDC020681 TaxID=3365083 RepID=UPI0037BA3E44